MNIPFNYRFLTVLSTMRVDVENVWETLLEVSFMLHAMTNLAFGVWLYVNLLTFTCEI